MTTRAGGGGEASRPLTQGVDTILFESPVLRVGRWRCPVDHPAFRNSGPTAEAFFVFPREPVWIAHEHELRQRAVFDHLSREKTPDPLFVEEAIVQVLATVSSLACSRRRRAPAPRYQPSSGPIDAVEALRSILATRFMERLSLADLAALVGVSVFHLSRTFRHCTGFTIHEYRTELRLRAALDRLADPSSDLLELAISLGFSSHSHFTETFRRRFGQTPSAYRRH